MDGARQRDQDPYADNRPEQHALVHESRETHAKAGQTEQIPQEENSRKRDQHICAELPSRCPQFHRYRIIGHRAHGQNQQRESEPAQTCRYWVFCLADAGRESEQDYAPFPAPSSSASETDSHCQQ